MITVNVLIDCIASLLMNHSFEFNEKIYKYVKLLNDLKSLEKCHKSITAIQNKILEANVAETYLGADTNKTNSKPAINLKRVQNNKKVLTESKYRLLSKLNKTDFNQRLLQKKGKFEVEQTQLKFNEIKIIFNSSLYVQNQLHSQTTINNIKIDEVFAYMKSVEIQIENRISYLKSNVSQLNKNIVEILNGKYLDTLCNTLYNSNIYLYDLSLSDYTKQKPIDNSCGLKSGTSLLNAFTDLRKIIDFSDQTGEIKSLNKFSQNESIFEVNWTDFLVTYNSVKKQFLFNISQSHRVVTDVKTFLNNLSGMEKTLNANLTNIVNRIDNFRIERNANTKMLNKLCDHLDELSVKNNLIITYHNKSDYLKTEHTKRISNLKNKIQNSRSRLITVTKNINNLHNDLKHSDLLFNEICQQFINQILLHDYRQSNKVAFFYEELNAIENKRDYLLMKRKKILLDQFNRKKRSIETLIEKKSLCLVETRNTITSNKNKKNVLKQYLMSLKDINVAIESVEYDLSTVYNNLVFQNHGKNLKHLQNEEIKLIGCISLHNKELGELSKKAEQFENYSTKVVANLNVQITNLYDKLQQVTSANKSLEMEMNKN